MREMPCVAAHIQDRNVSERDSIGRRFPPVGKEDTRRHIGGTSRRGIFSDDLCEGTESAI